MSASRLRFPILFAAGVLGLAIALPDAATAVDNSLPAEEASKPDAKAQTKTDATAAKSNAKPNAKPSDKSGAKSNKKKPSKRDKKAEQQFIDGYKTAHAMIYQQDDYAGGIAKLRLLGRDDHPDVANLIGFSSRKLGRYDDAKHWYEKALASNPKHTLTWSYYGMWHAEQGNLLKARDHLAKVQSICGTQCREYVMLNEVIAGTRTY